MSEDNLALWIRRPEPESLTLKDYCVFAQIASGNTPARIERKESVDDPIANMVIESLRFELENAHQKITYLEHELCKARGGADDD